MENSESFEVNLIPFEEETSDIADDHRREDQDRQKEGPVDAGKKLYIESEQDAEDGPADGPSAVGPCAEHSEGEDPDDSAAKQ